MYAKNKPKINKRNETRGLDSEKLQEIIKKHRAEMRLSTEQHEKNNDKWNKPNHYIKAKKGERLARN